MGSFISKFRAYLFRSFEYEFVFKPVCTVPECLPRPPRISECEEDYGSLVLKILSVDLCIKENGTSHHTSKYEIMNRGDGKSSLVVRRGQEFFLDISLSRDYDSSYDGLSVVFTLDGIKKPRYGHGTSVVIPLLNPGEFPKGSWRATIESIATNFIRVKIISPANGLVGKWKFEIHSKRKNSEDAISFPVQKPFYIIFNPWCKDDTVYLDGEKELQEYVMNEVGLIWKNLERSTPWEYSQFQEDILDCALYLMNDVGKTPATSRNDPVYICRVLSATVNIQDDNGVLVGNWSEDNFEGGKEPWLWAGSQNILRQFYKTKESVKYGQCWVFAGVLATVCRTLGIPCRVVTNFSSAHDTQKNLTIDYFFDAEGRSLDEMNADMVWNFHVWNEVWMKRMDLGPTIVGWQAIDATPQEPSGGIFCCGPTSINAVKNGEVFSPFDTRFLFAEVNADKVYWKRNGSNKPLKLLRKDVSTVGQFISTKAVGKEDREDITHTYKYPEGSEEEKIAMKKALRQTVEYTSHFFSNPKFDDIKFNFESRAGMIGEPISVVLLMKNRSSKAKYRVTVNLRVEAISYNQFEKKFVKKLKIDRFMGPGVLDEVRLHLIWEEYYPKLLDQYIFITTCLATVKDIDYDYFDQLSFQLRKPDIKIKRAGNAIVNEKLKASARFTNPLPVPLTEGTFQISGQDFTESLEIKLWENVAPGGTAFCSFALTPKVSKRVMIIAKFYSKELKDLNGSISFMVKKANDYNNENEID